MNVSDFLTIVGLGVAVWTLVQKKERNFILLFFSKSHLLLFIVGVFFLHFLFSFDWLLANWFPWLKVVTSDKGLPSQVWAYVFSLFLFGLPILKIAVGFFSSSRRQELLDLYQFLLKDGETDLLVSYLQKYHLKDIQTYLKELSTLPEIKGIEFILRRRHEKDEAFEKLIKPVRIGFAASVYSYIIQNENFVKKVAPKYPHLFAMVIEGMEAERSSNEKLVKLYLEILFESKNQELIEELKIVNQSYSSIIEINKRFEVPIVCSVLGNTKMAHRNSVWYPIGEKAVKSFKVDESQEEFLLREYDNILEEEQWNMKIYVAVVFFNYMVRETIYNNNNSHMWLFYYQYFVENITAVIPAENDYDMSKAKPSFAHSLINDIFEHMRGWLILAKEKEVEHRVIDTTKCIGACLYSICHANTRKIPDTFVIREIQLLIGIWFTFGECENNEGASVGIEWLTTMFLNPKWVQPEQLEITDEYAANFLTAYDEFDLLPWPWYLRNRFELEVVQKVKIHSCVEN